MEQVWFVAALWLLLALIAVLIANWLRVSTALSEIVVGTVAQLAIGALVGGEALGAKAPWITFLAGTGAIVLTFLAGAELDPGVFRAKWKESSAVGLVGFFGPFFGAALVAHYFLHWPWRPSWLAGVALSTTSVAVVYAVMLELGFNRTTYGKAILAACFINDLGTVLALGLIFSPFTRKTLIFLAASIVLFLILPSITRWFFERYGGRVSELETKYLLFLLFGLGSLAVWSGSEAVLPAYIIGMVLAGAVGKDHLLIRRLRTLTFGLLTPFYFIRAGSFVSVPVLIAAPLVFVTLFFTKMISKLVGLLPTVRAFGYSGHDGIYYSLMMSTGLTFGTISALFGLNHGIIDQGQYSQLVATVIASAVIPTAIANARFLPRHLLPEKERELKESAYGEPVGEIES
ncbi:MAG TPA: cation:proton antiporter [Bryobacteraceae bacterium]|jgi:Kef-type K+ transport system membrane component KefB|nr:cation:proton antiporter [Bryobacteraceae bacterium]